MSDKTLNYFDSTDSNVSAFAFLKFYTIQRPNKKKKIQAKNLEI